MAKKDSSERAVGRPRRIEESASVSRGFRVHPEVPRDLLEKAIRDCERKWLEQYEHTNSQN